MGQGAGPPAVTLRLGDGQRGTRARGLADRAPAWIVFAAALLATLGTLNILDGIAAASNSQFFVRHAHYLLGDLGAWGWTLVVVGICQAVAGLGVACPRPRGRGGGGRGAG